MTLCISVEQSTSAKGPLADEFFNPARPAPTQPKANQRMPRSGVGKCRRMLQFIAIDNDDKKTWRAELDGVEVYRGRYPHFGAARALIVAGHDPAAPVTTYTRMGTVVFRSTLGELAGLTVEEPDHGRYPPTLRRYRPMPNFASPCDQGGAFGEVDLVGDYELTRT